MKRLGTNKNMKKANEELMSNSRNFSGWSQRPFKNHFYCPKEEIHLFKNINRLTLKE